MILTLLLACDPERTKCESTTYREHLRPECPCADIAYDMANYGIALCRPDQTLRYEFAPQPHHRTENERQTPALVVCECVPPGGGQ